MSATNQGPSSSSTQNLLPVNYDASIPALVVSGQAISVGGLPIGISAAANPNNGQTLRLSPQSNAGANVNAGTWGIDFISSPAFAPAFFNDQVGGFGYNYDAGATFKSQSIDGYASAWTWESDYGHPTLTSAATAGTTTTTLNDSGQAFKVNALIGYTLVNTTRGNAAQQITANTATSITVGVAIPGQVSGDAYQIYRRDTETYHTLAFSDGINNASWRAFFWSMDKALALAAPTPRTITSVTAANPPVFTVAAGHNLGPASVGVSPVTPYVRFGTPNALAGGTWNQLNGNQFIATVLSATTFSIPVNATGFGAYTGNSGSFICAPPVIATIFPVSSAAGQGLQFILPSWADGPTTNNIVSQWDGRGTFNFYNPSANGINNAAGISDTVLAINGSTGSNARLDMFAGNFAGGIFKTAVITAVNAGRALLQLYDAAGNNPVTGWDYTRAGTGQLGNAGLTSNTLIGNTAQIVLDANGVTHNQATLLRTSVALSNNAAASTGTLTNAPTAGNPTKWIPINDNGTVRNIPAW